MVLIGGFLACGVFMAVGAFISDGVIDRVLDAAGVYEAFDI